MKPTTLEDIIFEPLHDRKGVSLSMPDDWVELKLEDAIILHERLERAIESASHNTPPAPAPMDLPGWGKEGVEFLSCDRRFEATEERPADPGYVCIGHKQVKAEDIPAIVQWLKTAAKYHGVEVA